GAGQAGVPQGPRARLVRVRPGVGGRTARHRAGGRVRDCRIALGGVAHAPWRAHAAERTLLGVPLSAATLAAAAEAELRYARPLPGNQYKVTLAHNLITSVLEE